MGGGSILDALGDVLVCCEQSEILQRHPERRQAVSRSTSCIRSGCCHLGNNNLKKSNMMIGDACNW